MLTRLALTSFNPNKPAELVAVRNKLVPKILDFLSRLGMPKTSLIVTVQKFDSLPDYGKLPGWKSFHDVTHTRNPLKNELISITCYAENFPVELRQFIFAKNYGHWINAETKAQAPDPKDATSGMLHQAVAPAFIDLTISNWERLLNEYR